MKVVWNIGSIMTLHGNVKETAQEHHLTVDKAYSGESVHFLVTPDKLATDVQHPSFSVHLCKELIVCMAVKDTFSAIECFNFLEVLFSALLLKVKKGGISFHRIFPLAILIF